MEDEKGVCIVFHLTRRSRVCGRNDLCILQHEQQVVTCCQTHSDYGPSKTSVKFAL